MQARPIWFHCSFISLNLYKGYALLCKLLDNQETSFMIIMTGKIKKVYKSHDCMHAREDSNSVAKMRGSKDISGSWETKRNDHILLRTDLVQGKAFKALQGQGKN
jgi:hypothetical protein